MPKLFFIVPCGSGMVSILQHETTVRVILVNDKLNKKKLIKGELDLFFTSFLKVLKVYSI